MVTGSMLLLLVGCLLVGSSQYARRLTRFLWRTEMKLNALVEDEEETVRRTSGAGQNNRDAAPRQRGPMGELTLPVMLLSLLYFLVFKWMLDLIFSALPLALWVVSIGQLVPADSALGSVNVVATGTTAAQVFTALAFAFLAHQLGVTSARGLLFVSRNVSKMLFGDNEVADDQRGRVPLAAQRGSDTQVTSRGSRSSSNYGTMKAEQSSGTRKGSSMDSTSSFREKPSPAAVVRNLYGKGRSASESSSHPEAPQHRASSTAAEFPYIPPMMPPPMPPPAERELPHSERSFRYDARTGEREVHMCGCKIVIKADDQEGGAEEEHKDSRVDRARRGERARGSRGGLGWGRGGGRAGLQLGRFQSEEARAPPPFPPFHEFHPWGAEWRERWIENWSHWQDWRWPDMTQRRGWTRGRGGRRGMRRRNSFDDVYAIAVPVPTTTPTDEDEDLAKKPAHTSTYEALDLTPSAPPLASLRPRGGSDEEQWLRPTIIDDRDAGSHNRHGSLYKSVSEPSRHLSLPGYYAEGSSSESSGDSDSDKEEGSSSKMRLLKSSKKRRGRKDALRKGKHDARGQRDVADYRRSDRRRLTEMQSGFRKGFTDDAEVAGEGEWERHNFDAGRIQKHHQKRAERKQERYAKKVDKREMKLRMAQEKYRRAHEDAIDENERYIEAKERDRYAKEIDLAAEEAFHKPKPKSDTTADRGQLTGVRENELYRAPTRSTVAHSSAVASAGRAPSRTLDKDPRKRALSTRVLSRPSIQTDQELRSAREASTHSDHVELDDQENKRSVSIAPASQAASTPDISDFEIQGRYGNIARSYDEDDVTNMRAYAPLSFTGSPPQYITALDTGPVYRGPGGQPDYDSFSPLNSPRSVGTGRDSFMDTSHDYDVLSPTNSFHDADFSTEKFQQVYRSIQSAALHQPRHSESPITSEEGGLDADSEFGGVPGRRDRVNFSAFAPPSVCPSPKPFQFTVWAFLLNQRAEMEERARSDRPESRKLSLETKLDVRRGALVHVTLEVPNGFRVLNGATQGFSWEGELSNVEYDVECTEDVAFGRVLFKAHITVGSSVATLNSFVLVGSHELDPSELEADVLEGWMDVMEQTYREIPYRSLEMKELVGQGYFGDAYRATLDGNDVVVKTIRASEFGETTSQIVREFQHEAAMLNMFGHHPCIVPFVGASTDTKFPLALITKYLPYGSMEDNLRGDKNKCLSIDERTGMLKDAAAGLLNIHEGGFIHRDLAARNCLVDKGLHVRICDFGLCRRVRSETFGMLMKDAVGPVKYMAPESLQPPHAFSYDSDVYMFGVLMWEAYTGSPPFASLTPVEAMMNVLRGERLPVPKEIPTALQTLMQNCFHDSPAERPSMQEVLAALDSSLASSQRASAVIDAAVATATAKSVSSRTTMSAQQDRSIWV